VTLTDRARRFFARFITPIVDVLIRLGVTPNMVTAFGFVANVVVAALAAAGYLVAAGIALPLFGAMDGLDGALARRLGRAGRFGAFLDSTLDRYSEAVVLLGLLVYATQRGLQTEQLLVYITVVGSLMVSYTRARAESLGVDCKIGLLTRLERFVIMSAMLIFQQVTIGLLVLAVLTNLTALQRMIYVLRTLRRVEEAPR
jgi:CDP-diacylglycerol--glycerol-3-phosphate 3-phosphatidyltransferase